MIDKSLFPPRLYAGIHKLAMLAHIGVMHDGYNPEFPISTAMQEKSDAVLKELGWKPGDRLVTIGAAVRQKFRRWPFEYNAEVADRLIDKYGVKILFVYGPGEEDLALEIKKRMRNESLPLYDVSLDEGVAVARGFFERSLLHISCDGGMANIAKCAGIPNITIFSSTDWGTSWTPPENNNFIAIDTKFVCDYRLAGKCLWDSCPDPECITSVKPDMILNEAYRVLDRCMRENTP